MKAVEALDGLLRRDRPIRQVGRHIHSVIQCAPSGIYDKGAGLYDLIVGGRLYNRVAWGCPVDRYRVVAAEAVASGNGPVVDVGCGSLVFTAQAYVAACHRPILLVDRSIAMLEHAQDRLLAICSGWPDHIALLQADALDLPFATDAVAQSLSWGVLHVMPDAVRFLSEMRRITRPGGTVHVSTLVTDRAIGRAYLRVLSATGEVATPRSSAEIAEWLTPGDRVPEMQVVGNMAFAVSGAGARCSS